MSLSAWCLRCGYDITKDNECDCSSGVPLVDDTSDEARLMGRVLERDPDDEYEQKVDMDMEEHYNNRMQRDSDE